MDLAHRELHRAAATGDQAAAERLLRSRLRTINIVPFVGDELKPSIFLHCVTDMVGADRGCAYVTIYANYHRHSPLEIFPVIGRYNIEGPFGWKLRLNHTCFISRVLIPRRAVEAVMNG